MTTSAPVSERVPGHFLQFGVVKTNSSGCPRQRTYGMPCREGGLYCLKPDPSARADDQNCRHGLMLPVGSAWLSVMCDAGSRTARWVDGLKRAFRVVVVARQDLRGREIGQRGDRRW